MCVSFWLPSNVYTKCNTKYLQQTKKKKREEDKNATTRRKKKPISIQFIQQQWCLFRKKWTGINAVDSAPFAYFVAILFSHLILYFVLSLCLLCVGLSWVVLSCMKFTSGHEFVLPRAITQSRTQCWQVARDCSTKLQNMYRLCTPHTTLRPYKQYICLAKIMIYN